MERERGRDGLGEGRELIRSSSVREGVRGKGAEAEGREENCLRGGALSGRHLRALKRRAGEWWSERKCI